MKTIVPEERLELAYELYLKKDYKTSLEYYEWFYDNAESIDSAYNGAKYRSLKEWYCLSEKYPPAMDALVKRKDIAYLSFKKKKDVKSFIDYIRVCHAIKHAKEAIEVFVSHKKEDEIFMKKVYFAIEDILIKNRQWKLCSSCIDNPVENYKRLLARFDELIHISNNGFNGEHNKIYEKKFEEDVQNLIWILSADRRKEEISHVLKELKIDLNKREISGPHIVLGNQRK